MEKVRFHSVLILLVLALTVIVVILLKQNHNLERENGLLILKSDSLHMLQIKTKKDLLYSNGQIDSISNNRVYKKRKSIKN